MAIPAGHRANFETLLRAAREDSLALLECRDARTGEPRYVICAVGHDGEAYLFTPFGHFQDSNPYEAYLPPDPTDNAPAIR